MYHSIEVTAPVTGGGYVRFVLFIAHIVAIVPVVSGPREGLTALLTSDQGTTYVEETRDQIQKLIKDAVRNGSDIPA